MSNPTLSPFSNPVSAASDPPALPTTPEELASLDPQVRAELEELVTASSPYTLWSPTPGPQTLAYHSEADELFYGGAAGGGKSALILGLALTQHQRSLIIRRESTQLRGMLDDIAKTLKTRDGLNNQAGQWRIPRTLQQFPDQLIEFGGVPNPGDEERHQGIAHDLLAFDEVTQISEYVVNYLSTWCRTVTPRQRTRIVLASNPPTPSTQYAANRASGGGLWLIRRYAPWLDPQYKDPLGLGPAKPGELRWFVTLDGQEQEWPDPLPFLHTATTSNANAETREEVIRPRSRTFIPSLPTDNPFLDGNYIATLQKHPEPLRSALLYGDFSVSLTDQPAALFPAQWLRAATQRHRDAQSSAVLPEHQHPMTGIAVDVARGGADSTVIQPRYGPYFPQPTLVPTTLARTGPEVATEILKHRRDQAEIIVDAIGVGASVYDHLSTNAAIENVTAYVGSSQAPMRDNSGHLGFTNLRSQSYWKLREALDPASSQRLAIPDDPELITELLSHTWEEVSGKIKVIPKRDVAKLLGRSPDRADALVMAHSVFDDSAPEVLRAEEKRSERLADARSRDLEQAAGPGSHRPLASVLRHPSASRRRARWSDARLDYPSRY